MNKQLKEEIRAKEANIRDSEELFNIKNKEAED
jgi:hypothetical protein